MVKISKLKSGKSHIRTFNTQAYCLTIKGMYLTTSVNNTFTVVLLVLLCHFPHKMCLVIYLQPSDLGDRQSKFLQTFLLGPDQRNNWILYCRWVYFSTISGVKHIKHTNTYMHVSLKQYFTFTFSIHPYRYGFKQKGWSLISTSWQF